MGWWSSVFVGRFAKFLNAFTHRTTTITTASLSLSHGRLQAPVLKKGQFIEDTFGQLMLTHLQTLHRQEVRAVRCVKA